MATITENLQTIKNSVLDIKQAIIDKGGAINGDITTWANSIANISSGGSGGSSSSKGDVTFYDYDGTVLHSFSKDEFLALNELPSLPTQPGLTCQGWNYDITKAKTYVEEYGKLDVGATYITDDGKTRLYIRIAAEGRMKVPFYFSQTVDNGVTIDWGDGSASQTLSGTGNISTNHIYANIGDYCITLTATSGCTLGFGYNTSNYCVMGNTTKVGKVYCNMLQKVEIGNGVKLINKYTFQYCSSLALVVIPNSVTSIEDNAFTDCSKLTSLVIPNSVKSIGNNAFKNCRSLASIIIPNSVTNIKTSVFKDCYSLTNIVIPDRVTSMSISVFDSCTALISIVIPNSITSIGSSFFQNCSSLASITIPEKVTSIDSYFFQNCSSIASIVIPNSVIRISDNVFYNCTGMAFYDLSNHNTIPTLGGTNVFYGIPSDCKIIVPDNLYDTWIAATNWSTHANKIIKKSDWDALQN